MTGSVVLPIKQLLMNLLDAERRVRDPGADLPGRPAEGLLGYTSQGGTRASQPILLFAVAFGLSTDYGVFLLVADQGGARPAATDREAVAVGLERTGRIVTAAALLFAIAIGAFATSQIVFIKELGLGTALAVLIDATIIRALLVPALMELLGTLELVGAAPLRRLHGRFGLSQSGPRGRPEHDARGGCGRNRPRLRRSPRGYADPKRDHRHRPSF